jgi:myosin-1
VSSSYTLAVGKAPFHASKPEKILVNVAKGEYAWPEVGKHANAIPDDLHNLVSQILVDETSRPSLDAIVSHDFLKIGFVPDTLGREAISCMPEWPVNLANTAIVKQGYSKGWYKQCKASGVGEYAPGKFFSLVGDSTCGSIYRECEREAEAGKMPLIPIPDGFFYIPFVSEEGEGSVGGLQDMKDVELISSHKIQAPVKTKKNIADTVKIIPRQEQGLELRDSFPPMPSIDMPPASSCTSIRRVSLRSASRRAKLAPQETLIPAPAPAIKDKKAQPEPIINERGPRGPFRTRSIQIATRTTSRTTAQPEVEPTEPTKPIQTTSCNTARANAYQSEAVQSTCTTSNTHSRTAASKATTLGSLQVPMAKDTTQVSTSELLILPSTRFTSLELQERTTSKGSPINVYTNLTTILTRVEELRNNIAAALESRYNASAALYNWNSPTDQLPFVSKWVDYSKKYGIGYILADGRVGLVANSTDDKPLTHTVVDDGCKYLKINYSKTSLDTVPFVFFTQADDGRLEEETMSEADRKQNGILWAKFGRYMCNNMNDPIPTGAGRQEEGLFTIVRYYQRLGNVSVWGFSNGCFQVRLSHLYSLSFIHSHFPAFSNRLILRA